ncbi:hypothetical protein ACRXCV_06720 [Halobacteriovorax sp. GFR7]|uniref:hypothetical protein n=1 Tax=unclassified Halobacteriovorax TaxID=2639665 RepID=UPI003D9952BB
MKNYSLIKSIALTILISMSLHVSFETRAEDIGFLKDGKIKDIIVREIANLNLSTTVKLLDWDKIKGVGVGLKYGYEMTPSYLKGKFARVDEWSFNRHVNPGSYIDAVTPINLTFSKNDRVTFIRHFDDQKKAILAIPYSINKLPYNAESTLKRLAIGDFVSIPAQMTLNFGLSAAYGYGDIVDASAFANVITSGNYNINIYRMDESKVRLKIVTRTSTEAKTGAKVKSDFFVALVEKVNTPDFVSKNFQLKLLEYNLGRGIGEQYVLDYIFDLSLPHAREAFDRIIKPKYKLNTDKMIGQYTGRKYIEEKLISDFSLANEIATFGTGVKLLFQGFNEYKFKRRGFKLGIFISDVDYDWTYYKNHISILNGPDVGEYFFPNKVYKYSEEFNILIHKRRDKIEESYFSFIPKDRVTETSVDFGTNYLRKDRYFTRGEWKSTKKKIKALVPQFIFSKIDFKELDTVKTNITTEVKYRLVLRKDIFEYIKNVPLERIIDEVNKIKKDRGYRVVTRNGKGKYFISKIFFWQRAHTRHVAKRIQRILNSEVDNIYIKLEKVIDNIDKNNFRKYFYRVVQSLVPIDDLPNLMFFKLDILGNRTQPVHFNYGEHEFPKVYYEILDINRDFHDSKRDFQIITE